MAEKNKTFAQTVLASGLSGGASSLLLRVDGFENRLEQIDEFFSASLFLTFMGVSATVGALLITLAPNILINARQSFQDQAGISRLADETRRTQSIEQSGRYFLWAVYPCFLGLVALMGLDGFFDQLEIQEGAARTILLNSIGADYGDELIEAIAGSAFLGAAMYLFFKGMFGLRHI